MIELDFLPPPVLKRQVKITVDGEERWIWLKESTYQELMMLAEKEKAEST